MGLNGPTALFYPHIHFRSRRWLRMAMLYYESISRIVPAGWIQKLQISTSLTT